MSISEAEKFQMLLAGYILQGQFGEVKKLVKRGANIHSNISAVDGATVLHLATQTNNIDMIKFFVSLKVDIDKISDNGATPLHLVMVVFWRQ